MARVDEAKPLMDGGEGEAVTAPRLSACRRYTLLAVSVFAVFSGYFNFDLPSITSKQLKSPPLSLSNTQLGLLFSVYAIPNTFLPLISGAFLQRVGVWNGVLSIAALKSSGVILVNIGIAASSYPVVLLGRVLYGLGGESLYVGIDVLTTTWFLGSELGFSYGLVEGAGQGGSFAAFLMVPPLHDAVKRDLLSSYTLGTLMALVALGLLVTGRFLDRKREASKQQDDADKATALAATEAADSASRSAAIADGSWVPTPSAPRNLVWRVLNMPVMKFLGFNHLYGLPTVFWCHLASIALYSGSYFTFLAFGNDFLQVYLNISDAESGRIVGMLSLSSIILSPIVGLAFDKFGGHELAATFALATSAFYFALLGFAGFTSIESVWTLVAFMGLSYGLLPSALYPAIAEAVPEESFTPVYSILVSSMNIVLAITTVMSGALSDTEIPLERRRLAPRSLSGSTTDEGQHPINTEADYTYVFMVFVIYCSLGTITSGYTLYVKWYGKKDGGGGGHHRAPEPATLRVDMTADGNLSRSRSVKGVELQEVAAEARSGLWAAADAEGDADLGGGYASFQGTRAPKGGGGY